MVYFCCVNGCKNEWYPGCSLSFHRLPKDLWMAAMWKKNIAQNVTRTSVICNIHFKDEDFVNVSSRKRLKANAVPSIFPKRDTTQQTHIANADVDHDVEPSSLGTYWLRNKLSIIWTKEQHCGLCLESIGSFFDLDNDVTINAMEHKCLADILSYIMNLEIKHYVSSNKICKSCTEKSVQSYVFIKRTKQILGILENCVNDISSKVTDIDNELKDTYNEANINVMIVTEYDKETEESINNFLHGANQQMTVSIKSETTVDVKNTKPKINPTQNGMKHLRKLTEKHTTIIKDNIPQQTQSPFSLQDGKIVIAPLKIQPSAPEFNTYSCNSCQNIFSNYRSLKEHEKTVHAQTIFQCRICHKKYLSQQYVDSHYIKVHSKSRCKYCKHLFDTKKLNDHLKEMHRILVKVCKVCDMVYYNAEQLNTHLKLSHNDCDNKESSNAKCVMCLKHLYDNEIKTHKCKFSCLDCLSMPCIHYKYLMSYREQILNHVTMIRCLDCDYSTNRKENLIAHVNREHIDHHPFTCDDCGNQFYTKLSLRTHIEQFHNDLKCQYCDREFKTFKLFNQHRSICKGITREYSCDLCVASFHTQDELTKHVESCQSDVIYPCTLCKKEFANEISLTTHLAKIHSGVQRKKRRNFIECTLCDITFKNRKEMTEHEQTHDPKETYPCRICSKRFSSLTKMYAHKQKHYKSSIRCAKCNKLVVSHFYKKHVAVCSKFRAYICQSCKKKFHSEIDYIAHRKIHLTPEPCPFCFKLIKPSSMKNHCAVKHSIVSSREKNYYNCEYCNYVSQRYLDLENHINKIHLKVKPYICEVCSKEFCGKMRLNEHLKTHSENTCFCGYCGKKFANKVCLKMHTRKHTGEKPYECNICSERFRSSSIMKTHRLKRHQDKTIQCPLCDSMFHLLREMRQHVKKTHWKKTEKFDFREIVPEEHHHLFVDRRLQTLGEPQ